MSNFPQTEADLKQRLTDCPPQRLAYSVDEASSITGLGRTTLYNLINAGKLARTKVGKRTLVKHDDLERLLSSGTD